MATAKRFIGYTTRGGLLREPERTKGGHLKTEYVCHCVQCGQVFFSKRPHAKYDTNACRQRAYRKRRKFEKRVEVMRGRLSQLKLGL